MAAGLRAIFRSGVVTFIVLGAGAVFLILGIAGVSLRANCYEAGVCVEATDALATGSIAASAQLEGPAPQFAAPTAPPTRESRLKSAGGMIAATFTTLQVEPERSGTAAEAVEPVAVAAVAEPATGPEDGATPLAKRVVKSIAVTPQGQPVWTSPAGAAIAAVAEAPANPAVAVTQQVAAAEPVPEIEPLAFSATASAASASAAPIPQPRPASVSTQVAAATVEPEAPAAPEATGDRRIVAGQGVNVRSGPSSSREKLFALKGGAEVTVSDKERGWLKVTDEKGRTGWVYSNYLKPAG